MMVVMIMMINIFLFDCTSSSSPNTSLVPIRLLLLYLHGRGLTTKIFDDDDLYDGDDVKTSTMMISMTVMMLRRAPVHTPIPHLSHRLQTSALKLSGIQKHFQDNDDGDVVDHLEIKVNEIPDYLRFDSRFRNVG